MAEIESEMENSSLVLLKTMKDFLLPTKRIVPLILFFGLTLFVETLGLYTLVSHYETGWRIPLLVCTIIGLVFVLIALIMLYKRYRESLACLFVLIAIPTGIAFALFMLPFYVPDEYLHISRLFDYFSFGYNTFIPADLLQESKVVDYQQFWELLNRQTDYSDGQYLAEVIPGYSPFLYLIPSIGVFAAKVLGANIFVAILVARLFNLAFFLVCGYFIIKIAPLGKTILFVYLLNPMLMQQQASCSADALTNIVALGFLVLFLRLYLKDFHEIQRKELLVLAILLLLLLVCKFIYVLLALVFLAFLPRLNSRKAQFSVVIGLLLLFCLSAVALLTVGDSSDTVSAILTLVGDPGELVRVYLNTYKVQTIFYISTFAGGSLGLLDINTTHFWLLYIIMLISTMFVSGEKESESLGGFAKGVLVAVGLILAILIPMSFRMWGLEVDGISDYLQGAQGRYFIPVFILFLLGGYYGKKSIVDTRITVISSVFCLGILAANLLFVIRFFY